MGTAGAITATAHNLARIVDGMLKNRKKYVKEAQGEYDHQSRKQKQQSLRRRAAMLGMRMVPRSYRSPRSVLAWGKLGSGIEPIDGNTRIVTSKLFVAPEFRSVSLKKLLPGSLGVSDLLDTQPTGVRAG